MTAKIIEKWFEKPLRYLLKVFGLTRDVVELSGERRGPGEKGLRKAIRILCVASDQVVSRLTTRLRDEGSDCGANGVAANNLAEGTKRADMLGRV
jgi:hypothetical protein